LHRCVLGGRDDGAEDGQGDGGLEGCGRRRGLGAYDDEDVSRADEGEGEDMVSRGRIRGVGDNLYQHHILLNRNTCKHITPNTCEVAPRHRQVWTGQSVLCE
jgi:hypothetical protein